jgi:hypothetical protein
VCAKGGKIGNFRSTTRKKAKKHKFLKSARFLPSRPNSIKFQQKTMAKFRKMKANPENWEI